jgi:hypothetical protein
LFYLPLNFHSSLNTIGRGVVKREINGGKEKKIGSVGKKVT